MVQGFDNIGVCVTNLQSSVAFYELLGLREFDFPFAYSPCSARSLRMRPSYMPIVFLCQSISR